MSSNSATKNLPAAESEQTDHKNERSLPVIVKTLQGLETSNQVLRNEIEELQSWVQQLQTRNDDSACELHATRRMMDTYEARLRRLETCSNTRVLFRVFLVCLIAWSLYHEL